MSNKKIKEAIKRDMFNKVHKLLKNKKTLDKLDEQIEKTEIKLKVYRDKKTAVLKDNIRTDNLIIRMKLALETY